MRGRLCGEKIANGEALPVAGIGARGRLCGEEAIMRMKKAIFWDLHGTLGGEATGKIEEFEPFGFALEALARAREAGFLNIIVTNQSRIGRGEMTLETYKAHEGRILGLFGGLADEMLCCPHTGADGCDCKKPKPGLVLRCAEKYGLALEKCWIVGDMGKNEIVLAKNAGCRGALVLTGGGKGSLGEFRHTWQGFEADLIAGNALEAIEKIIKI